MDRRRFLTVTAGLGATAVAGCLSADGSTDSPTTEDESENPYKSVVRENVRANEQENLELLKETMHEESPVYDQTIEQTQEIWETYDLTYELEELEVTKRPENGDTAAAQSLQVEQVAECEEEMAAQSMQVQQEECAREAHVRFVQVTRKESGPEFRDNRIDGTHILRPSDGDWKIWTTETESVEPL